MALSVAAAAQQEPTNHFEGTNSGVLIAVQELQYLRTTDAMDGGNPHYLRVVLSSRSWHRLEVGQVTVHQSIRRHSPRVSSYIFRMAHLDRNVQYVVYPIYV